MDWARLNFSHGSMEERREAARLVREASRSAGRQVKILVDLEGPKGRIGSLQSRLDLRFRDDVILLAGFATEGDVIPLEDPRVFKRLRVGDRLFLDDGAVAIDVVERLDALRFRGTVAAGGRADSRCGLAIRGREFDFPVLSGKDFQDLAELEGLAPDAVAQSMVGSRADVDELKRQVPEDTCIVAKIERSSALSDLERISAGAWGLMVARGDLGVNIPRAQVPLKQKSILEMGRRCGCFTIVATQLLLSMVDNPRPNRSEVADVTAAVVDGSDALMLSEETSIGSHPAEVVRELAEIIETVEASRWYKW